LSEEGAAISSPDKGRAGEGFKIAVSRQSVPILANIACILNRPLQ